MAQSSFSDPVPSFRRLARWLSAEDGLASRHIGASVVGVAVILILAAIFLTLAIREQTADDSRSVEYSVLRSSSTAETELAAIETAHRTYLLLGQPQALDQFRPHLADQCRRRCRRAAGGQ